MSEIPGIEASEGKTSLEFVKREDISLVLLDLTLPDMDGFEVCTNIREEKPELPIIIVSARGQDMEKIMGLELGADDYIVKPFNPLELVARIRSVLKKNRKAGTADCLRPVKKRSIFA